jgi:hypothetical protein
LAGPGLILCVPKREWLKRKRHVGTISLVNRRKTALCRPIRRMPVHVSSLSGRFVLTLPGAAGIRFSRLGIGVWIVSSRCAARAREVVSKDEVIAGVWGNTFVVGPRKRKRSRGTLSAPDCVTSWILELEDVFFRPQKVIRQCRPLQRTALLVRQPCAPQHFGSCQIPVDNRFCKARPHMDKNPRRDSHSMLEGRTELGRPFEWRSPRSASNTS